LTYAILAGANKNSCLTQNIGGAKCGRWVYPCCLSLLQE